MHIILCTLQALSAHEGETPRLVGTDVTPAKFRTRECGDIFVTKVNGRVCVLAYLPPTHFLFVMSLDTLEWQEKFSPVGEKDPKGRDIPRYGRGAR
ncbi:hypothetical protein KIPB_001950 [Kipferlia bialata]|uniref:Uncharacterized protein n=1 Tax=Kipferlia bialata TaxID=797122 RepID=A0A9K3CRK8_9EUKA|nr:hypothetical protein KIPB_001950 [Kipferlia bialata]|eukprot:g1950.t1